MQGCTYVIHVASPFVLAEPKEKRKLIAPAVEGPTRVVRAAHRAAVTRLVLTSLIVPVTAGRASGRHGPDSWANTDANIGAYAMSKTLAERAAWDINRESQMELTVINPGGVFDPSLGAKADGQSVAMISVMIGGKMPMIPDVAMGMVDVRDVARPHVMAPNTAVRLMSLFDRQAKAMVPLLGTRIAFDTSATSDVVDWQPTPMEASFKEMAASLGD